MLYSWILFRKLSMCLRPSRVDQGALQVATLQMSHSFAFYGLSITNLIKQDKSIDLVRLQEDWFKVKTIQVKLIEFDERNWITMGWLWSKNLHSWYSRKTTEFAVFELSNTAIIENSSSTKLSRMHIRWKVRKFQWLRWFWDNDYVEIDPLE